MGGAARWPGRIALRAAATLALWASTPPAQAQAPAEGVTLSLDAPAGCPGEAHLRGELERLLGDAARRGPALAARVRVQGDEAAGFSMTVAMVREGRASERTLSGPRCATLVDAAALLTAIAHDPGAVAERGTAARSDAAVMPAAPPETSAPPPPPPPPAPTPPPVVWIPPRPAPPAGPRLGALARAGGALGVGDLPGVGGGLAVAVGLTVDAYRAEVAFELGLGASGAVDGRPEVGADFSRLVGVARGCRQVAPWRARPSGPRQGELDLGVCLGVELGALSGEGFGVAEPGEGSALWAAPRLDVRPTLGLLTPLSLVGEVGLAVPVDPRRYVISGGASVLVVHEPAPVAGRLGLGLELRL